MSTPHVAKGHGATMLCYAILQLTGEICCQIFALFTFLHIFCAVFTHCWPIVFGPEYSGSH